jgi:molybdenum cofactor biosynthesis enzyme MoaA
VELENLDELWFQVSGTLCNLSCSHCFISCNPKNDSFGLLDLATVRRYLAESRALGVKEYYFTGGEPFLNQDMLPILEETLRLGPASVLTNGTLFRGNTIADLRRISLGSPYSLEIRVSIDGYEPAMNDPLRGEGTFAAAMRGVDQLVEAGFLPIITMVQTWPDDQTLEVFTQFSGELRRRGYSRPRIKILPTLKIGMEEARTHGYMPEERITGEMMANFDPNDLLCSHSRIVTDRGVAVCPILIETPAAHLGQSLADSLQPFPVVHSACYTCYLHGTICSNTGATLGTDR